MPFPMKVQPIDSQTFRESSTRNDVAIKPVLRSRLKKLFDRPFTSVLRIPWAGEKSTGGGSAIVAAGDADYFEPSSVCLDKMVQNFIEDNNNEKPLPPSFSSSAMTSAKYGRNRCNCFNGNGNDDSSNDELGFSDDASDTLKSLIPCASTAERNLLADTSKIVDKNKACKLKADLLKIITDDLFDLGYAASICKSKWEKSYSIPAGEYEYIDVVIEDERIIIDVDFQSEFEIARSTGSYKAMLQSLPFIFVGKTDRLVRIISLVSGAAKRSLKKKGMHIPPWRKAEYIKNKWLSSYSRRTPTPSAPQNDAVQEVVNGNGDFKEVEGKNGVVRVVDQNGVGVNVVEITNGVEEVIGDESGAVEYDGKAENDEDSCGEEGAELDLIFGEKVTASGCNNSDVLPEVVSGEEEKLEFSVRITWQPPPVSRSGKGDKVTVTGLASLLMENP